MKNQIGFGLIEMLIAMFIGSVLLTLSTQVLIHIGKSNRLAQQNMQLEQAGNIAKYFLERDIRRAGFFAGLNKKTSIKGSAELIPFSSECIKDSDAFSRMLYPALVGFNSLPINFSCISKHIPGSDILVLRYLKPAGDVSAKNKDAFKLYMRTSLDEGKLFKAKDRNFYKNIFYTEKAVGLYEPITYIYYLRETQRKCSGEPIVALFREYNNNKGFMVAEEVVSGIVQMQLQFLHGGKLKNADQLKVEDWQDVESVSVDLLLSSECREANHTEAKSYTLGDVKFTTKQSSGHIFERLHFLVNLRNRNF